jgi:iron-sulfur cluster repair protein YtfE (RIC family)
MTLSIIKLEKTLNEKGFIVMRYFVMDGFCFYIELLSANIGEIFLLYIPSKYTFEPPKTDNVFKLKSLETNYHLTIEEEYGNIVSIENQDDIRLSPSKDENLEKHLEMNYRKNIMIKDISKEDNDDLKTMYKQVVRLSYSTKNIPYKFGISYKNYICAVRRDDSVECFGIKNCPRKLNYRIMIIVDLEVFYEKNDKINENIMSIKSSLCNIMTKNHNINAGVMKKLTDNTTAIAGVVKRVSDVQAKLDDQLYRLSNVLASTIAKEDDLTEQLSRLNRNIGSQSDMMSDMKTSHKRSALEKELGEVITVKEDTIRLLIKLKEERETSIINTDKVMFDNTILFDHMLKNFSKLQ